MTDRDRIALGIRQPWVELILRGVKTLEIRTQPTRVRGAIYVYASKTVASTPDATAAIARHEVSWADDCHQRLVGTIEITGCRPTTPADAEAACLAAESLEGLYAWTLANPKRLETPQKPRFLPYGVWFYPYRRRQ